MARRFFASTSLVTKKTPESKIGKLIAVYCFRNGDMSTEELQDFVAQVKKEVTTLGKSDPRIASLAKVYTDLPGTGRKWFDRTYYSSRDKELGHFIGCMFGPNMVTVTPTWADLGLMKAYGTPMDFVPAGLTKDAAIQELLRLVVEAVNRLKPDGLSDAATQTPAVVTEPAPLVQRDPETDPEART